jgi:hypothetical protein
MKTIEMKHLSLNLDKALTSGEWQSLMEKDPL